MNQIQAALGNREESPPFNELVLASAQFWRSVRIKAFGTFCQCRR
jgi:hypothetical protein